MRQQWNDVRLRYKDRLSDKMAGKSLYVTYGMCHNNTKKGLKWSNFFSGNANGLPNISGPNYHTEWQLPCILTLLGNFFVPLLFISSEKIK